MRKKHPPELQCNETMDLKQKAYPKETLITSVFPKCVDALPKSIALSDWFWEPKANCFGLALQQLMEQVVTALPSSIRLTILSELRTLINSDDQHESRYYKIHLQIQGKLKVYFVKENHSNGFNHLEEKLIYPRRTENLCLSNWMRKIPQSQIGLTDHWRLRHCDIMASCRFPSGSGSQTVKVKTVPRLAENKISRITMPNPFYFPRCSWPMKTSVKVSRYSIPLACRMDASCILFAIAEYVVNNDW